MTMHHLIHGTKKLPYESLRKALAPGGLYIEGDYVVSEMSEREHLDRYAALQREHGFADGALLHIDIPFSVETQEKLLAAAGFTGVETIFHHDTAAVLVARGGIADSSRS